MNDLLLTGAGRGSYGEAVFLAFNMEVNSNQTLQLDPSGTYDFTIDWGDGSSDVITSYNQPEATHTYASTGVNYDLSATGTIDNTRFIEFGSPSILNNISQWGNFKIDTTNTFTNTKFSQGFTFPETAPNITTQNLTETFYGATGPSSSNRLTLNLNDWDVSNATSMSGMFQNFNYFDLYIGDWDVSNVTNFSNMFYTAYNSSIADDITGWDTSSATNMSNMFRSDFATAIIFNQDISTWNVGNVTDFSNMFRRNNNFNQPIGSWDTSSATTFEVMFWENTAFNQPIGSWDTSNVTSFGAMFGSSVPGYSSIFNQDLSGWDFTGCSSSSSLQLIFGAGNIFSTGGSFAPMSQANYEALLISWANQAANMPTGMTFILSDYVYGAGSAAETARNTLVNTYSWTITDAGAV